MIFCTNQNIFIKLHTCVTIKFLNKSWYMIYCAFKMFNMVYLFNKSNLYKRFLGKHSLFFHAGLCLTQVLETSPLREVCISSMYIKILKTNECFYHVTKVKTLFQLRWIFCKKMEPYLSKLGEITI